MKNIIISGFNIDDNNRGTAALSYGSIEFLRRYHNFDNNMIHSIFLFKKPWKFRKRKSVIYLQIGSREIIIITHYIWFPEYWLMKRMHLKLPFGALNQLMKSIDYVAAINGGDGFSDIYNEATFKGRLFETQLAMMYKRPLIILPQTLGPFKNYGCLDLAEKILKYASYVYVRDLKFEKELAKMNVSFRLENDLSYYMLPQKVDIDIEEGAIGLNISGLAYSNGFRTLSGKFDNYPNLIMAIIKYFQKKNKVVYLLAHSYNFQSPEDCNDDLTACKDVYDKLISKKNVRIIDRDLTSPEIKYIISQFSFFIGTRMHANFAAIFTKTPVFGLSYSYKFAGSFEQFGLSENYTNIVDISKDEIDSIVKRIDKLYATINSSKDFIGV